MTNFDKELFIECGKTLASAIVALLMLLMACVMCGCKTTEYVPVETVRAEYKDRVNTEYVIDSVVNDRLVYINGDTVFIYKWRDRWRTETKHDSIYVEKRDTVRVPYPVERELTKWEKAKMDLGGWAFCVVGVALCVAAAWLIRKKK